MWTSVPGYEGIYEAHAELCAVRSLDRAIIDRRGQVRLLRGRVLAGYRNGMVILSKDGQQEIVTIEEVMNRTFRQPVPA